MSARINARISVASVIPGSTRTVYLYCPRTRKLRFGELAQALLLFRLGRDITHYTSKCFRPNEPIPYKQNYATRPVKSYTRSGRVVVPTDNCIRVELARTV